MRIGTVECKHCGIEYKHQFSGSYKVVDTPKEYTDKEYCPGCKKAIVDALDKVAVKFEWEFLETREITLEQLLKAEEELYSQKNDENRFPIARRVFATLYNEERGECLSVGEVKYNGKLYSYSYWPSDPRKVKIKVRTRINLETGKPA